MQFSVRRKSAIIYATENRKLQDFENEIVNDSFVDCITKAGFRRKEFQESKAENRMNAVKMANFYTA